jgi:hypothetical protein
MPHAIHIYAIYKKLFCKLIEEIRNLYNFEKSIL